MYSYLIHQLLNYLCVPYIQVNKEVSSLIESCRVQLKVAQLTSSMAHSDLVGPGSSFLQKYIGRNTF